ncbi:hypothetical protein GOBAR_DD09629 [Gossypium barbadense]|nr:hypothetical protein GOBAR_DD09629 [Gossypium barbadense]
MKDVYPFRVTEPSSEKNPPWSETLLEVVRMVIDGTGENGRTYRPRMLVEKKSRRKSRDSPQIDTGIMTKKNEGSHFRALSKMEIIAGIKSGNKDESLANHSNKEKKVLFEGNQRIEADDGGSTNSGSATFNDDSGGIFESFSCPRLTSEGSVDVIVAEMNSGLDPSRHMTIIFKETKDPNPGVSMNGVPFLTSGKGKSKSS